MKKLLKILVITLVVMFLILLILPFAFKGKIIEIIKTEANKSIRAKVEFEDVNLSLIRNFPNLAVGIEHLSIAGVEEFEGDTLASMDKLSLVVDIMTVIKGDNIRVKKIELNRPRVLIKVLEDGAANYDITIDDGEAEPAEASEESSMALDIEQYSIHEGHFVYDDATLPMTLILEKLDHKGVGDFSKNVFTLVTESKIEAVTAVYDGIHYLAGRPADLDAEIAINLDSMKFTFKENRLDLAQLSLKFDGWLAMPEDDIDMDITYALLESDLRAIMSLVPAVFTEDLDDVTASGDVAFEGFVRGTYNDESMPGFGIDLRIADGRIQYPDLPKNIENIHVQAAVATQGGRDMNDLTVDVPRFHLEIGGSDGGANSVDASLSLRNAMVDPHIDTKVKANIRFADFKDVIPMEEQFSLEGNLTADFFLNGALSAIENQRFNEFQAGGSAAMTSFAYADGEMDVKIPEARVAFSPEKLDVETVKLNYGGSNMELDGFLSNYVAYALSDTTLQGEFNFYADRIDAGEFMGESTEDETEEAPADTAAMEVITVPDNLDLTLNARVDEILYDDLVINALTGKVEIKNAAARLDKLNFNTLGGNVNLNGEYNTKNETRPSIDFGFAANDIDIKRTYDSFETIQKMAPIANYATGKISLDFDLKSDLDATMTPVYETMEGGGNLRSENVVLEGGDFLQKLSKTLMAPDLARQEMKDIDATVVIEGGKVFTEPFDVKIGRIDATISGHTSFEETIDYTMALKIPSDALGKEFNQFAAGLLSGANAFLGGSMSLGEFIRMNVRIHGDLYDPNISPQFAGMEGSVKDQVKDAITDKIDEEIDKAKEKASEKAQELLEEAQKRADKLVADAQKAGQKLRDEAEKQAKKLEDDAKNPLAKAGAKIAADKIRDEADKQANNLVKEARQQADNLMKAAREEASKLED